MENIMGTRYHITKADMAKLVAAGVATMEAPEAVYGQEYNEEWGEMQSTGVVNFYVHAGSIGNWAFEAFSEDGKNQRSYIGPNWNKEDLDEILDEHGIEPEFM